MNREESNRPIRFVMIGGFLGSGKTTTLIRLARHYSERGLRVGIITNDQAADLVDTLAFREAGYTTEEIPAGCFCCHFEKLLEASGRLADGLHPDVILAEPVGSCTDLVNAVIAPLKALYTDRFSVAPYAVLADPDRLVGSLTGEGLEGFSKKVTYLYKMQQNEADIIVLNKVDQLAPEALDEALALVGRNFPKAKQLAFSARTGEGFDALVSLLDGTAEAGQHPADVDYGLYTEGEIALGWLNARVRFSREEAWDGDRALERIARAVHGALVADGAEVAHFKMRLQDGSGREAAVHSTNNIEACDVRGRLDRLIAAGELVVNVRAEAPPEVLDRAVLSALEQVAEEFGLEHAVLQCKTFAPSPPVPPPPSRLTVRV